MEDRKNIDWVQMADKLTKQQRSWNMSRVKSKNTKPEITVRSILHGMGFRFRLHSGKLPGKPDIVLPKYKSVIFVHGCFWHRHKGCKRASIPATRREFWDIKFAENVKRDKKNKARLRKLGWNVLVIWECWIEADAEKAVEKVLKRIFQS